MTRRTLLLSGVATALLLPREGRAQTSKRIQTAHDFYPQEPRAAYALLGPETPDYAFPGDAASASGRAFWWGKGLAPIVYARWLLIWDPNGSPENGVQLQTTWNTPTILGAITGDSRRTPITSGLDLTAAFQAMQQAGESVYVYQTIRGGPVVFASTLELVWDLS